MRMGKQRSAAHSPFPVPVRFKKNSPRQRHFVGEWRRHRGLSQAELGAALGISKASVSRIERSLQPYTQDVIEAVAEILQTDAASLLTRRPDESEPLLSVWERIPSSRRRQALALLDVLARTEPDESD
jgi:transcriptional regulator with XRE-family HTH domain